MHWKLILMIVAGCCFLLSTGAFFYIKIALRPKRDASWEQTYWEFEEHDPALKRYQLWSRIAFAAVVISMLLIFLSVAI